MNPGSICRTLVLAGLLLALAASGNHGGGAYLDPNAYCERHLY